MDTQEAPLRNQIVRVTSVEDGVVRQVSTATQQAYVEFADRFQWVDFAQIEVPR